MRSKLAIFVIAATLPLALPAAAHFPPTPDTNCNPAAASHDFTSAGSATGTTGMTGETGGGVAVVYDGAAFPCGFDALCPSGENFLTIDPSGDDLPDGTDPSGDDVAVACDAIVVGGTPVPLGDGEYEFGFAGAFLPDTHHDPLTDGYTVSTAFTDGGFIFGSDADDDGDVEEGSIDCYESRGSAGTYTTSCAAGADGGWWMFTRCNATTASDWTFTTNGALLRGFGDDDEDGIPNAAEDDDADGAPNGAEDNDADGAPDVVNANWNPTVTPGSVPPDFTASCLVSGHVSTPGGGSGGSGDTDPTTLPWADYPSDPDYVGCIATTQDPECVASAPPLPNGPEDIDLDEDAITAACAVVHLHGSKVYDSANNRWVVETGISSSYHLHHSNVPSCWWNQEVSTFSHTGGSVAYKITHDEVRSYWPDGRVALLCVTFHLGPTGTSGTAGRCDWVHN